MAMMGQDVEQVRQLAGQLNAKADEIQNILTQLTTQLQGVHWEGPDAMRFKNEWSSTHTSQLRTVINALQQAAQTALTNASQQEQASA